MGVREAVLGVAQVSMFLCLSLPSGREEEGKSGAGTWDRHSQKPGYFPTPSAPHCRLPDPRFIKFSPSVCSLPAPFPLSHSQKAHSVTHIGEIPGQEEAGCG